MSDINPDVRIRKAIPKDAPALIELIQASMRQYAQDSGIPTLLDALMETPADMLAHIESDTVLIAESHGQVVGTVRLSIRPDHTAYFSRFAVVTRKRQSGIGKKLIALAEALMTEAGATEIRLHTAVQNKPLVNLYSGKGFELIETSTDRGYERGLFRKRLFTDSKSERPESADSGQP